MNTQSPFNDLFRDATARRDYEKRRLPADLAEDARVIERETELEKKEAIEAQQKSFKSDVLNELSHVWLKHLELNYYTPDGIKPQDRMTDEKAQLIAEANVRAENARELWSIEQHGNEKIDAVIDKNLQREHDAIQKLAGESFSVQGPDSEKSIDTPVADLKPSFDVSQTFNHSAANSEDGGKKL